ncbi:hypothetical protein CY34DRAFT_798310 [Suillus luteus UH-Slu-Lm8-n1]|uniref:Uncharacterized protein n=1 Tax=Suillus luteus UH-Slu-Lm8-n1 TaxID=930992 RepID=A0A0D0B2H7_9AGAM|nr:hypothetical protein CY34DRAFT_798310 [Suillus luteus UH-Slu-Lm8-n1]
MISVGIRDVMASKSSSSLLAIFVTRPRHVWFSAEDRKLPAILFQLRLLAAINEPMNELKCRGIYL